jgi:hypothetical protein
MNTAGASRVMNDLAHGNSREADARTGRRLEYFTLGWNLTEAVVGIGAGLIAGSIALIGFGVDSIIESFSGASLLWRLPLLLGGKTWRWMKAVGRSRSCRWKKMSRTAVSSFNISPLQQRERPRRSLPCSNWKLDCVLPPHRSC